MSSEGAVVPNTIAVTTTTLGALPAFLLSGLGVLSAEDLGFDERGIGYAIGVFFAAAALFAARAGRLGDRLGPRRSLQIGVAISVTSLLTAGGLAQNLVQLMVCLAVGGVGFVLVQMGGNVLLVRAVPLAKQGLSFAVKQSAIPLASMIGGAAVPLVGLTVGWRWAFVGAVVLAAILVIPIPEIEAPERQEGPRDVRRTPLLILASSVMFCTAAANAASAFLVPSTVASGIETGQAGILLATGSVAGALSRLVAGWAKDRFPFDGLYVGAALALVGGAGLLLIATLPSLAVLFAASVVAFVGAFGWSGLFVHAVAHSHPEAAGLATGIAQSGIFVGGIFGPPLFGLVASTWSYPWAWLLTVVMSVIGAVLMVIGRHVLYQVELDPGDVG